MKKVLLLLVLVLLGVYVQGAFLFSESGANDFLNELESLSLQGKSDEFCARLHDDMKVSIDDHSAEPPANIEGGKREFCDYVSYAARGLDLLGVSTQVQRDDFTVRRSWLHPWTAEVSYNESRTTQMSRVNATLYTESDDQWTLVNTFSGVKVMRLTSKVRPVESP
jgi:hypothetical protein